MDNVGISDLLLAVLKPGLSVIFYVRTQEWCGRKEIKSKADPRHRICFPFFIAQLSHPAPTSLEVTQETGILPEFSKWLIDTIVTLQSGGEVFYRHLLSEFPDRKTVCICPSDSSTWMRLWEYSRGQGMNHYSVPSSFLPATCRTSRHHCYRLASTDASMCLVFLAWFAADASPAVAVEVCKIRSLLSLWDYKTVSPGIHSTFNPTLHFVLLLCFHCSVFPLFSFPFCHIH